MHNTGHAAGLAWQWWPPMPLLSTPLTLVALYVVYQRLLSPFSRIPGPFWASLSRLWLAWHAYKGDVHAVTVRLHEKYGKVVRIAPSEVSICDASAVKTIYGAGTKFRKSDFYIVWQGKRKLDLFAERDEAVHAAYRRLVSRPYAMSSLKELEPYVDDALHVFLGKMKSMAGQSVDMGYWFQLFAFDVVGEMLFSKSFGLMEAGDDGGAFQPIEHGLATGAWMGQVPWLYRLNDLLSPLIPQRLASGPSALTRNLAVDVVRHVMARRERSSSRPDILGQLLKVHEEKPQQFDECDLGSMAVATVFAGSDTTAISTRAVLYHLLKNPHAKQCLVNEIDEFWQQGKLSDPVALTEADSMPYLQAVLLESLRYHPAVGLTLPRVVPSEGLKVDGRYMPAGSTVGVNAWAIHRSKEVYGDDACEYRPERWLAEETGDMHRCFFAFGAGARTCLGKHISWMEMSKLIPTLFLRFDIELINPDVPLHEECHWFVMQKGLKVTLAARKRNP